MTFQLTAWEPPPERRPYEVMQEGGRWQPASVPALRTVLERFATYPDDARARIDAGETVRLQRYPDSLPVFVRRVDSAPDPRQLPLI